MSFITINDEEFLADARKSGNSLVVGIPKEIRERLNIQDGDHLHLQVSSVPDREYDKMDFLVKASRNHMHEGEAEVYLDEEKIGQISRMVYSDNKGIIQSIEPTEGEERELVAGVVLSGSWDVDFVSENSKRYIQSLFRQSQLTLKITDEERDKELEVENVSMKEYLPDMEYGENLSDTSLVKQRFQGTKEVD